MKQIYAKKALAMIAFMLLGGVSSAWAQDLPTPVYFNDFSSKEGLTQVGSGEFVTDTDDRFGQIYHNNPDKNKTARTNYLKLPEHVLTHSSSTKEMTIGFWVNLKTATKEDGYFQCPVFSAYKTSTPGVNNGSPMFRCSAKGVMQLNVGNGIWTDFTKEENDDADKKTDGNTESTVYLDDAKWHYYTVTLTTNKGAIYVDGDIVNSWTLSNEDIIPAFFTAAAENNYSVVCLGGNQSWDWNDWDASFGYDDFVVYDKALSAKQIAMIMANKLHYTVNAINGSGKILKVLADDNSTSNTISVVYPKYILDGTTLREAAATNNKYKKSYTLTTGNQVETIAYTNSSVSNVYYYAEAEDVYTGANQTSDLDAASNGKIGGRGTTKTDYKELVTLPAGKWNIYTNVYVGNSGTHTANFKVDDEVKFTFTRDATSGWFATHSEDIVLESPATLSVAFDGGSSTGIDWIYVSGKPANTVVGNFNNTVNYLEDMSDIVTLSPGKAWHYKFVNHNMGPSADWAQNWILPVYTSDGTTKKIVIRSDNWEDIGWKNDGFSWTTSSGNWYDNFITEIQGATVDMTISYSDANVLSMSSTITTSTDRKLTYSYNSTSGGVTLSGNVKIALSVSKSWLELLESWPVEVSGTIPSSGFGSLACAHGLDFANATVSTGTLTAFAVTDITASTITLTSVNELPANSGVILKGTAGATYSIPVKSNAAYDGTNKLKAAVTAYNCAANEVYILQGGQFHLVTEASTVPAGKAYLLATDVPSEARSLTFDFNDGELTGISEVVGKPTIESLDFYDLQGRKVTQPTKGLYIANGKKVVIK